MRVELLGQVSAVVDGSAVPLRAGRQRRLLAMLALDAGRPVSLARVVEALWPEDPPVHPANAVQQLVAQLRRALGPHRGLVETVGSGYRLAVAAEATDAGRVQAARAAADRARVAGDWAAAETALSQALALWRGPSLGGIASGPLAGQARRLDDLRADLEVALADLALASDRVNAEVVDRLAVACARHPWHEPLWLRRLTALARAGRPAAALAGYEEYRRALADELGVEPSDELRTLHLRLLRDEVDRPGSTAASRARDPAAASPPNRRDTGPVPPPHQATSLPTAAATPPALPQPLTSFVGRTEELAVLDQWRADGVRLVSLTGAGGVGKTRLAIEYVRSRGLTATLTRLAEVSRDGDVLAAVAATMGLREIGTERLDDVVARSLAPGTLLVLDNAEHVRHQVAALTEAILTRRQDVSVLTTTQVRLGVPGERLLRVTPLAGGSEADLETAAGSPAVRLLLDRAGQVRPELATPDETDRAAAVAVAAAVDGLPLGIELAAARAAVLTLPQLAASLDDRLTLLDEAAPGRQGRHRRLPDAVGWSADLLTPASRELLTGCAVFSGCFDVPAVAAVTGLTEEVALLGLVELAERSLVQPADASRGAPVPGVAESPRFRLLPPVRAFGLGELERHGRTQEVRDRLLSWVVTLAEAGDQGIRSAQQRAWLHRLDAARGDIDQALSHALAHGQVESAGRVVAALGRYWDWRGRLRDTSRWSEAIVAAGSGRPPVSRLGAVVAWAGFVAVEQGEGRRASELLSRGVALSASLDDADGRLTALAILATQARGDGRFGDAHAHNAAAIDLARQTAQPWGEAWGVNSRGYTYAATGDLDAAGSDAEESLRRFRQLGDERAAHWAVALAALVAYRRGERATACALAQQVRAFAESHGDLRAATLAYDLLAALADDDAEQLRLQGVATAFRARRGQVAPLFTDVET